MSVFLTHSTSIIEGESDTSFEEKRAHEFMTLRNLSKCTLLCWIITMVQMKENLQQITISIFLFLCGALNSVDTRQHKEIYCNRYQV